MSKASAAAVMVWLRDGAARHQAGDLRAAERLYDKVLRADPNNADALNLKGLIALDSGRPQHALSFFDRAAKALPGFADPYFNKGLALTALERPAAAIDAYAEAIRLRPDYGDALLNSGLLLFFSGRAKEAIETFRRMAERCPADVRGHYNLAASLEKILALTPAAEREAVAQESEAAFRRALALDPGSPDIHYAFSNLHTFRGAYREAAAHLEIALRARPHWPDAWNNLANQAEALGDRKTALTLFERALEQDPANAGAIVNRGMTCLALGKLAEGWKGYERRFDDPRFPFVPRHWPWPKWRGEDLAGKTILVWGDQGIGDEILYGSMIQEIAARAGTCVVECEPRLIALYQRSLPELEIFSTRGPNATPLAGRSFDFHCSVLDLGAYLRPSFRAFPNRRGFLRADAASSKSLREKYLAAAPQQRLVGISWRSVNPGMGHQKSLDLSDFLPVLTMPDTAFVSLQYGDVTEELSAFHARTGILIQDDPAIDPLANLDSFASQVAACDSVVTISNSTAHFAGALDVPTALYVPDGRKRQWYWFETGNFSPWYRSIRVFRRDGASGIGGIRGALEGSDRNT